MIIVVSTNPTRNELMIHHKAETGGLTWHGKLFNKTSLFYKISYMYIIAVIRDFARRDLVYFFLKLRES